ncbi:hypothetical protein QJS10_CPB21g00339 [Acorus calamus]|uniref:Uncharacterized protein n=1 Tax=Acorus calamus TaxID=4465 RepID=A0AAV9C4V8_ACOCL|nr:hypothetical protein QJS10_CPB21g00339 [Acorus calamus]
MQQRNMGFPSQAITIGILIGLLALISSSSHVHGIRGDARLLLPKLSSGGGGGLGLGEEKRPSRAGVRVSPPQPAIHLTGSCWKCPPHPPPPPPPAPSLQVTIVAAPPPPVD